MVAGAVVGDDTFPLIVGAALLLLGASILFVMKLPQVKVARPYGEPRMRMILGAGVLALPPPSFAGRSTWTRPGGSPWGKSRR